MINHVLKNFCLITFALIAPITLPAGGIQKSLHQNKFPNNTNEIILSSNTSLYSCPEIFAKELLVLDVGTTLTVLRNWKVSKNFRTRIKRSVRTQYNFICIIGELILI